MATVKAFCRQADQQGDRQTNKQTGQKLYACPHASLLGHKKETYLEVKEVFEAAACRTISSTVHTTLANCSRSKGSLTILYDDDDFIIHD